MAKAKDKKQEEKVVKKSTGKGERFVDMSAESVVVDESSFIEGAEGKAAETEKQKEVKVRGKKYLEAKQKIDTGKNYSPKDAFELLKKISFSKSNRTVEAHLNVAEKGLSGDVSLPHSTGKVRKVVIFSDEVAEQVKTGKIDFDILLATAADMPKILPLAKALGPKGLMPNPKNGTLVPDPKKALENFSGNTVHYKTEKDFPIIHTIVGKVDQPTEELTENLKALVKAVNSKNIKKAVVKSTMSPGIKVNI